MFVLPTFNLGVVGTVFAAGGFNISTRDTKANISTSSPTNPSGEVTIAYGTDTEDLYVWDGSTWYVYNNI
jgi:hypothetical protein